MRFECTSVVGVRKEANSRASLTRRLHFIFTRENVQSAELCSSKDQIQDLQRLPFTSTRHAFKRFQSITPSTSLAMFHRIYMDEPTDSSR